MFTIVSTWRGQKIFKAGLKEQFTFSGIRQNKIKFKCSFQATALKSVVLSMSAVSVDILLTEVYFLNNVVSILSQCFADNAVKVWFTMLQGHENPLLKI